MKKEILIDISHWLIGTLNADEVDSMEYGDEAYTIAMRSVQFKSAYEWSKWRFNRRKKHVI